MIVLEVNKVFQYLIGLESFGGGKYQRFFTNIAPIMPSMSMLLTSLWMFLNFIFNVNDNIQTALASLPGALAYIMLAILHWHLVINRIYFYSLFEDMQAIINESTYDFCSLN